MKKISRAEELTDKDILPLYETIVPLLYAPSHFDPTFELNKLLLGFVYYDFDHYIMDTPEEESNIFFAEHGLYTGYPETIRGIQITRKLSSEKEEEGFINRVQQQYETTLKLQKDLYPDLPQEFSYHRIISCDDPKFAYGFFRMNKQTGDFAFTQEEIRIFEKLKPHIFRLMRAILWQRWSSERTQYFQSFIRICSGISSKYNLSATETKLLPEILFGYSNKVIADRNFISTHTAKTHVHNIFKKTGVKNRMDFMAKFFTSPERVELR